MGFSDGDGKPGSFAEQYTLRRETHLTSLQQKEEEMRQKFVIRVKEKESELKEAEREVRIMIKQLIIYVI
jgi:septin 6/8/11